MTTTVHHIKDRKPGDIYIGRPSVLGNPFVIGRDGSRQQVIERYTVWLHDQFTAKPEFWFGMLRTIRGRRLICYCKPLACHGDVLAALADAETGVPTRWEKFV